ncbi:hypothetical protein SAMD00019534_029700 [Acytostelium subglobosum LB1]|uniref:hypothetical protein n=1 Tax=Acytostelium subglobosum LB1 TaxID=1410327 RepID=UPI0006450350|nr:hypothetical protein SAMD00019534_029700 [Acytostelium subglobosum LB1]GAM19795.1 hypothetical protein SAMD00019534_029700 [Acytostelium subglobosum LB1]|eukprot:XP_012756557.1 hypothetical protein SAMD00019534_029700 [Acytostelium subglobosum LB1]
MALPNATLQLLIIMILCHVVWSQPDWWIQRVQEGRLMSTTTEPEESLMASVGNGFVAMVIDGQAIYIGGVYNGPQVSQDAPSHRAQLPNFQHVQLLSGASLSYAGLDLDNGTYTRVYTFNNTKGTTATQTYYAHREFTGLLVQEITLDNTMGMDDFVLELATPALVNISSPDFNIVRLYEDELCQLYLATILQPELEGGFMTSVAITATTVPSSLKVAAGQTATLVLITSLATNLQSQSLYIEESMQLFKEAMVNQSVLLTTHIDAWSQLWTSRIEVGGNLAMAQTVNSSLYYILSSINQDWPWSLSPGGLASNGYNGHVFWDAETWMYPPILVLYPEIARDAILQYRINNLNESHLKAVSYGQGWTGYMFPWESAFTGAEVCPLSAPTGQLEQHITGDISFAMRQYYYATGDDQWLLEVGYQAIKGIAEFWASRVASVDSDPPSYSINNVIPPDEYAVGVNNSVYTNTVAKLALEWAAEAAAIVKDTSAPIDQWLSIASNLVILFNETGEMHPEYEGYAGQMVKQADVILLGYPLMTNMSATVRQNDLAYYEPRTDPNGPAMTYSMFVTGWLELGNQSRAEQSWASSYANSQQPFGVWTETPTGGTVNFITGAGGFLQGILFGYGGLRIQDGLLDFHPQLPPNTDSLAIRSLCYQGAQLDVLWTSEQILVTMTSSSPSVRLAVQLGPNSLLPLDLGVAVAVNAGTKFSVTYTS